jgi:putative FmdB family regulatory protein
MPIYEYRCEACGHQEEFLQKISEPQLTECPVCHKPTFNKMLSAAGFQLKGSGWYATDFKSKGSAKPSDKGGEKSDGKPADAKTDAKTDAKPETKTQPKSEAPA